MKDGLIIGTVVGGVIGRDRHVSLRGFAAAGIALASMTAKAATAAKPPKRHLGRSSARWAILLLVGGYLLLRLSRC